MLPLGFFVIHDTIGGSQHNVTKLTGRKQVIAPLVDLSGTNIEARRDDTALVEATIQLDNNLSTAVVIDNFEFSNVAYIRG